MADPVVITRPLAQAAPLAQKVAAIGRDAVVFPLLEIHSLNDRTGLQAAFSHLDDYAMVAFVSPNAIDVAFSVVREWPRDILFAVVGEGSRAALAQHGMTAANARIVSPRDPHRTDSQTLLAALDLEALKGRQALIVRGQTGRELLADALRAAGVQVTQVAAYRRAAPVLDQARIAQLLDLLGSVNDWVITSSEALHNLLEMVKQVAGGSGVAKMQQQRMIVPHIRIQETAQTLGFCNITLTGSGDERLLAALQSSA